MALVRSSYQTLFGEMLNVMVIHAGLECGLFKSACRTGTWSPSARPSVALTHRGEGTHPGGRAFLATAGSRAGTYPGQISQLTTISMPRPVRGIFCPPPRATSSHPLIPRAALAFEIRIHEQVCI